MSWAGLAMVSPNPSPLEELRGGRARGLVFAGESSASGPNLFVKPRPGKGPVAFGRRLGNTQHLGGFGERQADKIAEFDQFGALWVELGEFFKGFTNG